MNVTKNTILITGCSDGGLGAALAIAFQRRGWTVFAAGRSLERLGVAKAAGCQIVLMDVQSDKSIQACADAVAAQTGGSLDILLNNAGAGYSMPVLDIDLEQAQDIFDLNVFSIIRTTRAFFPLLHQSIRGAIIANNTSGVSLPVGAFPFQAAYSAFKAAATNLTETMRHELRPFNIRVVNILTGMVKSKFQDNKPSATLPSRSLYNLAKLPIEKAMSGEHHNKVGSDPAVYAADVARSLSKVSIPHWLFKGHMAFASRIGSLLPIGTLDSIALSNSGLLQLEQAVKQGQKSGDGGRA